MSSSCDIGFDPQLLDIDVLSLLSLYLPTPKHIYYGNVIYLFSEIFNHFFKKRVFNGGTFQSLKLLTENIYNLFIDVFLPMYL